MSGLSGEDRDALEWLVDHPFFVRSGSAVERCLTLLDQYEEALRAADDLVRVAHEHPQGGMAMIHVAPALDAYIEARPNIVIYRSTRSDSSPSEGEAS